MRLILIDNFDSFTYNIAQALQMLGVRVDVVQNNAMSAQDVLSKAPSALIIGPGPGTPTSAGISAELVRRVRCPLLGICLGHQVIGEVFGATLSRAKSPLHGKTTPIKHDQSPLFAGVETPFTAARYHSLILENLPSELIATAWSEEGEVMGLRHRSAPIFGVQFHPDSIATPDGVQIFRNFIAQISHSL